jgi:uncharacterized membrane protein
VTQLILAAAVFVLLHLLVSGTRLRGMITGVIGEGPYQGLFSLASLAAIVWLSIAYTHARGASGDVSWWTVTPATRPITLALVLLAFLLLVPGLLTRNPTSVRQEGALNDPDAARGMLRITRHPFLWGVALWAVAHLIANGDAASVVLFGSLLFLALIGPPSIDAKRAKALGDKWAPFKARTSSVPFAAILAGRQSLKLGEVGWWRIALALVVYAAVIWAHPRLFGVPALG